MCRQELEKLVDAGLVKAIGVSNFSLKQVEALLASARVKPVCNQVELHPQLPQRKLVGVCFRKVRPGSTEQTPKHRRGACTAGRDCAFKHIDADVVMMQLLCRIIQTVFLASLQKMCMLMHDRRFDHNVRFGSLFVRVSSVWLTAH